jgi:hypothetical protein
MAGGSSNRSPAYQEAWNSQYILERCRPGLMRMVSCAAALYLLITGGVDLLGDPGDCLHVLLAIILLCLLPELNGIVLYLELQN